MFIPLVRVLGNTITRGANLLSGRGGKGQQGSDRATVVFDLCGAGARCDQMTYVGALFAARGRGTVSFAQALDLVVNAGPLEKMQTVIGGRVGRVFGRVTDALANYRVTGTVQQPRMAVELVGGTVNRAVGSIGKFANAND
jgi:hypothetical protein